jgi:adenylylsulfate reductase subunit B
MSIEILKQKCVVCGKCAEICPGSLIKLGADAAYIKYPKDCWGCASCVKECPNAAIRLYLGADSGGSGGRLSVTRDGALLHWTVETPNGGIKTITVDSRDSNKY